MQPFDQQLVRIVRTTRADDLLEASNVVVLALRATEPTLGHRKAAADVAFDLSRRYECARPRDAAVARAIVACARLVVARFDAHEAITHPTGVLEGRAQATAKKRDEAAAKKRDQAEENAERVCREALGEVHAPSIGEPAVAAECAR